MEGEAGRDQARPASLWPTLLVAFLPFLGWWTYGLFDLDEGFYGSVVAEMNRRHEWITPYYNGHPWFEKPILLYWVGKPLMAAFGDAVGARLPSVLAAIATMALIGWFAKRRFSPAAGQMTILVLGGSLFWVLASRMMIADPLLVLCETGAMIAFWESLQGSKGARAWCGLAVGFGTLAKGPVAIFLFAVLAAWTYWREPDCRKGFRGGWLGFWAALLVSVSCWYLPAYLQNGYTFIDNFFIKQNLERFTGGDTAHNAGLVGLLIYPATLFVGMFPWSLKLVKAWPRRGQDSGEDVRLKRYVASWAGIVFIFFTISSAKLPSYVLPCLPPLALLLGVYTTEGLGPREIRPLRSLVGPVILVVVVGVLAQVGFSIWYDKSGQRELHSMAAYVANQSPATVAAYQMPRRDHDLGTLKPKIQETSHPSLPMVVNRPVLEVEKFDDLLHAPLPVMILTRTDRIQPYDFAAAKRAGLNLEELPRPDEANYKLFLLTSH